MQDNAATFALSGTPTPGTTGVYTLGMKVTDSAGHVNVQTLTLRIGVINVITTALHLADAALGAPYDVTLAATGTAPIAWSMAPASSSLPPGLSLGGTGHIAGTPTSFGFTSFVVRAVDATGQAAFKTLSINVVNLPITTSSLPVSVLFQGYSVCPAPTAATRAPERRPDRSHPA
jgi:hypothetical protein